MQLQLPTGSDGIEVQRYRIKIRFLKYSSEPAQGKLRGEI